MPPVPNQPSFDDPELRFSSSLVFFVNGKKVTCSMLIIIVMTINGSDNDNDDPRSCWNLCLCQWQEGSLFDAVDE